MTEPLEQEGPNSDQIEFWNGVAGGKWVDFNPLLDRMLKPVSDIAMDRANPIPGEHVLDVGCGCGGTSLELAARVAPGGTVTGLDISTPMLALARERAEAAGAAASFINADAETHALPAAAYDLLFSRFGIMFFSNPKVAFANFQGALKPGGRAVFVCWRDQKYNPWVTIPFEAARPFVPEFEPPEGDAPGQFAFAREGWVEDILSDSGFTGVRIERHDTTQRVGEGDLDSCVELILKLGPVSRLVREADEDLVPAITAAVREAVAPHHDGTCIALAGSVWIVAANRP
jgi:SAM-dependent methyltransferase